MGRAAVALTAALIGFPAPSQAQAQDGGGLQQNPFDPGLKLSQMAADSLAGNTQGRYGIMGMDFGYRTSFVVSEGGAFECGSFQLLPAACAIWLENSPFCVLFDLDTDGALGACWLGDAAATEAVASRLGTNVMQRWLDSGGLLATTLSDGGSGLPYSTSVWDAAVMLALVERRLGESLVPPMSDTLAQMLEGLLPSDAAVFGTASFSPGGCRAAIAMHLADGRHLGLAFFADSLESDSLVVQRLRLLTAILGTATLHPAGFAL